MRQPSQQPLFLSLRKSFPKPMPFRSPIKWLLLWLKDVLTSGHSRLPVYEDDQDNVIGILHVKDILKNLTRANVETMSMAP